MIQVDCGNTIFQARHINTRKKNIHSYSKVTRMIFNRIFEMFGPIQIFTTFSNSLSSFWNIVQTPTMLSPFESAVNHFINMHTKTQTKTLTKIQTHTHTYNGIPDTMESVFHFHTDLLNFLLNITFIQDMQSKCAQI